MKKAILIFLWPFLALSCKQPTNIIIETPPVSDASYTVKDNNEPDVSYNWININSEPDINLGDEEFSDLIALGFVFRLFDTEYTGVYINSNGFITLQPFIPGAGSEFPPEQIPDPSGVNSIIAGFWADLDPSAGGSIKYTTVGTDPDEIFVITYTEVPYSSAHTRTVTFQILLFQTSNDIIIQVSDFETDGKTHTIGIENYTGNKGCFYSGMNLEDFNIPDEYTLKFKPVS